MVRSTVDKCENDKSQMKNEYENLIQQIRSEY